MDLTVLIPAHNAQATIEKCLRPVLGSAHVTSVVVVLDSCTDDTPDIVRDLAARDPRVRCFDVSFRSAAKTRNFGLQQVQTEWIALLDSDDFWLNDVASVFATHIGSSKSQTSIICADQVIFPAGSTPLRRSRTDVDLRTYVTSGLPYIISSTVCFKRDLLPAHPLFPEDLRLGEDIVAWCRLLRRSSCTLLRAARVGIDRTNLKGTWGQVDHQEVNLLLDCLLREFGPEFAVPLTTNRVGHLLWISMRRGEFCRGIAFARNVKLPLHVATLAFLQVSARKVLRLT